MRNRLTGLAVILLTSAVAAQAGTIDVTSSEFITVPQGATIEFEVAVPGSNPTSLAFQILGQSAAGQPSSALPGSSQQYDPQFLLDASLTSVSGAASAPLVDSAATRLGLNGGSMVVTTGVLQGSQSTNVNMINASVQLSQQESSLIFGSSDLAYVVLHNDGAALLLGIGSGYDLTSAMVVSSITATGSRGGTTQQVSLIGVSAAPEPQTYVNLAGGFALLAGFAFLKRVSA